MPGGGLQRRTTGWRRAAADGGRRTTGWRRAAADGGRRPASCTTGNLQLQTADGGRPAAADGGAGRRPAGAVVAVVMMTCRGQGLRRTAVVAPGLQRRWVPSQRDGRKAGGIDSVGSAGF
jgi:hypothetical protein